MAKIDLEKVLIALLDSPFNKQFDDKVKDALKEQGLEYKDGEIVESQRPKFHEGDFIKHNKANLICKVISVNSNSYYVENIKTSGRIELFNAEQNFHLWTIEDAKDGDVLAAKECYVIFKEIDGLNIKCHCTYHYMGFNTSFHINTLQNKTAFQPATKEQRDLLFQKMEENGYEWDNEKKELKKIEKTRPMLSDFFNAEYERGKASFANRQLYNRAILAILSNYVEKYPDIRFGQMLFNLGVKPHFNQESKETYCNLNETINKQKS